MLVVIIPEKICKRCSGNEWYLRVYKRLSASGEPYKTYVCRHCDIASSKKWVENNPEAAKAIKTKSYNKLKQTESYKSKCLQNRKRYVQAHKDTECYKVRTKESKRKSYLKHKTKILARNKKWSQQNPDKACQYQNKLSICLTDSYVKAQLSKRSLLNCIDISPALIELKRKQLLLTRAIRHGSQPT